MIKKYIKNNQTFYMVNNLYLGINPITGKEIRKSKKGFKTKKSAQIYINKLKSEYDSGNLFRKSKKVTVNELASLFLDNYKKSNVKICTYRVTTLIIDKFSSKFGNIDIEDISFRHIQKFLDELATTSKVSSLKIYAGKIRLLFKFAIRTELLEKNPTKNIILPRKTFEVIDEESLYYSKEELKEFFSILENYSSNKIYSIYVNPLFRLLAFTGARIGEILALTWNDFDFKNNIVHITKNIVYSYGKFHVQTPKNTFSIRSLKLDDVTIKKILELRLQQKEFLFAINTKNSDNIVFFNPNRTFFSSSSILQLYCQICKNNNFKTISLHAFRHTHCSLLFEAGASIQEVQRRLGHSNIETTMNIYNHVSKKIQEETSEKFAKYVNF